MDPLNEVPQLTPQEQAEQAIRPVYRELSDAQKGMVVLVKSEGITLYTTLCNLPSSREVSLAKTKLEEAVMWAVKAVTK